MGCLWHQLRWFTVEVNRILNGVYTIGPTLIYDLPTKESWLGSEVRLVREIDDEVSQVGCDEVCEDREADEWQRAGWGLWSVSSWWVMMIDELDKVSKMRESILHREWYC